MKKETVATNITNGCMFIVYPDGKQKVYFWKTPMGKKVKKMWKLLHSKPKTNKEKRKCRIDVCVAEK